MVRTYDFTGRGYTGLFVCHISQDGMTAVFQANLYERQVKSVSYSVLSGILFDYVKELQLFLNRLNRFTNPIYGAENVITIQDREDTYHDEDLIF